MISRERELRRRAMTSGSVPHRPPSSRGIRSASLDGGEDLDAVAVARAAWSPHGGRAATTVSLTAAATPDGAAVTAATTRRRVERLAGSVARLAVDGRPSCRPCTSAQRIVGAANGPGGTAGQLGRCRQSALAP